MENIDYTKINLRDFRHNLTQLKDSLACGQVYEVTEKGVSFGYFIPASYEIKLKAKVPAKSQKSNLYDLFESIRGKGELIEEIPNDPYYKKLYLKQLRKKYKV